MNLIWSPFIDIYISLVAKHIQLSYYLRIVNINSFYMINMLINYRLSYNFSSYIRKYEFRLTY
uniref:Uncharacterized protein n=1 Tax=Lepeophtheirus salmonis TaxID=72036 RepID=A0A0K2UYV6_LEPSM